MCMTFSLKSKKSVLSILSPGLSVTYVAGKKAGLWSTGLVTYVAGKKAGLWSTGQANFCPHQGGGGGKIF